MRIWGKRIWKVKENEDDARKTEVDNKVEQFLGEMDSHGGT